MKKSVRGLVCGVAVFTAMQSAHAADLDYLRGSEVFAPTPALYSNWSGFYVGAQVGYADGKADFSRGVAPLVTHVLRDSALRQTGFEISDTIGRKDDRGPNYGGFIGYNSQWENVVLGIEANYNKISFEAARTGSANLDIAPGNGFVYHTAVDGGVSLRLTDYGTLRGRAGYAMGSFMPYLMAGAAFGRADINRSATVTALVEQPNGPPFLFGPVTETENKTAYMFGYAFGGGIDVMLWSCLFLRGEAEWIQFGRVADVKTDFVTGRVAAGWKF
jgi:outer membrane immunogenic protein